MLSKKLIKYLQENQAKFDVIEHKVVYTAYDAAQTMKVKLNEIAKSLLVKFNKPFLQGTKPYAIVIVGADKNIDLKKLKKAVSTAAVELNKKLRTKKAEDKKKGMIDIYNKVASVSIPKEKELKDKLKIKPGAMAAFGAIYKLPVFIDKDFLKMRTAIFAGDSFKQSIKMLTKDFYKLEDALAGSFGKVKNFKKSKVKKAVKAKDRREKKNKK